MDYDRLLQAISQVETGGSRNPDRARSPVGALGAHQVKPSRQFSPLELMNPQTNRLAAMVELNHLASQLPGDISEENRLLEALPGYHLGPNYLRRLWGLAKDSDGNALPPRSLPASSADYSRRVVEALQGRSPRDMNNILAYPARGNPSKDLCNQTPKPSACLPPLAEGGLAKLAREMNHSTSASQMDPNWESYLRSSERNNPPIGLEDPGLLDPYAWMLGAKLPKAISTAVTYSPAKRAFLKEASALSAAAAIPPVAKVAVPKAQNWITTMVLPELKALHKKSPEVFDTLKAQMDDIATLHDPKVLDSLSRRNFKLNINNLDTQALSKLPQAEQDVVWDVINAVEGGY